jgi:hypothetical protein
MSKAYVMIILLICFSGLSYYIFTNNSKSEFIDKTAYPVELTIIDKNHIPFMVRIGESEYRINPDIIFTGSFKDREYICSKFYAELRKAQKDKK